jgi:hypothetical protein
MLNAFYAEVQQEADRRLPTLIRRLIKEATTLVKPDLTKMPGGYQLCSFQVCLWYLNKFYKQLTAIQDPRTGHVSYYEYDPGNYRQWEVVDMINDLIHDMGYMKLMPCRDCWECVYGTNDDSWVYGRHPVIRRRTAESSDCNGDRGGWYLD